MASLSISAITQAAANAGFTGADLSTAVAIALAESSGNPSIIGDQGNSFGLWQINVPSHPSLASANLLDPQANADAAFAIYQAAGNSFQPWTTYNSGAYQQYMGAAPSPAISIQAPADTSAAAADDSGLLPSVAQTSLAPAQDYSGLFVWVLIAAGIFFGGRYIFAET